MTRWRDVRTYASEAIEHVYVVPRIEVVDGTLSVDFKGVWHGQVRPGEMRIGQTYVRPS